MPTREKVYETYWSTCWKKVWKGKIPYPCKKTREVYKWCYNFSEGTVRHWGFYCEYEGKEGDTWYTWTDGCLGVGSKPFYNKHVCFDYELSKGRL